MLALLHYSAALSAQESTSLKDMAELFAAISDKGLTTFQKNRLIGATYAGVIEVYDVQEATRLPGGGGTTMIDIVVEPGIVSMGYFITLSFRTADVERAAGLRRGDKVRVQGKLARIRETTRREFLEFEQVTIGEKVATGPK